MKEKKIRKREWKLREPSIGLVRELSQETGLSELTIKVCVNRGLDTKELIERFFAPKLSDLTHPFEIEDMEKAIDRLVLAKEKGQKVRVFGDYDVDGTSGAALLSWTLREYGFSYDATQPDRFKDGYGLNINAVEQAAKDGIHLLVTVDCGITNFDQVDRANELGLDVIIVDHHQLDPKKGCPNAFAVVNPQRPDCASGLTMLCGCGLAFYVAMGLRMRARSLGWFESIAEPNLKSHLDLVVVATAADLVPLVGDNRILVAQGLRVLKETQKPGLKALMDVTGLTEKTLSPGHLGFTLGPRINASGRMQNANVALELLTTQDRMTGLKLAYDLEKMNEERMATQDEIWDEVKAQVDAGDEKGIFEHAIVVSNSGWHEGVVGIVASRVTETYHRPAIILSIHDGKAKGSARTFAGKDVLEGIRQCSDLLTSFGGHRHAAGLSLPEENILDFQKKFNEVMSFISEQAHERPIWLEGITEISEFNLKTLSEIEQMGPFGPGNTEPVFSVEAKMLSQRVLKERHLKMKLGDSKASIEAIYFHGAERSFLGRDENNLIKARWAVVPEINRFRGNVTPTLRVRDFQKEEKSE